MKRDVRVLLHNIRSAHNVGAIFRTADAVGVSQIYITGYTPAPTDRFGRPMKDIAKTALGAEHTIPWKHENTWATIIRELRGEGFTIVGLEQDKRAVDYRSFSAPEKMLFLVGSEVRGLSPAMKKQCAVLIEIPMRGTKESLNVSVAFGVALFRILE